MSKQYIVYVGADKTTFKTWADAAHFIKHVLDTGVNVTSVVKV